MKTLSFALMVFGLVTAGAYAGEYLQTLKADCWVCSTPEAYDVALADHYFKDKLINLKESAAVIVFALD